MTNSLQDKPKTTTNPQASCGSLVTLGGLEENLSAYFEPFGAALAPVSPGARDSIASNESDSALLLPRSANDSEVRLCSSLLSPLIRYSRYTSPSYHHQPLLALYQPPPSPHKPSTMPPTTTHTPPFLPALYHITYSTLLPF